MYFCVNLFIAGAVIIDVGGSHYLNYYCKAVVLGPLGSLCGPWARTIEANLLSYNLWRSLIFSQKWYEIFTFKVRRSLDISYDTGLGGLSLMNVLVNAVTGKVICHSYIAAIWRHPDTIKSQRPYVLVTGCSGGSSSILYAPLWMVNSIMKVSDEE